MEHEHVEEVVIAETETEAEIEGGRTAVGAQRPKRDIILPISILIAAVMIAGALVFATIYKGGGNNGNAAGTGNTPAVGTQAAPASATTTAAILTLGPRDAILGDPNAPVTVIEYGDYQCPFCADYFQKLEPTLKQQYINTGKVKMVFRDLPFLGAESDAAANAAQCAEDQNALWAYHDALYTAKLADDAKGGGEEDGFFTRALFLSIASQLHLSTTTFASCISSNTDANYVAQEKKGAETLIGGDSTPTTFVNGAMVTDASGQGAGDNQTLVLQAIAAAVAGAK